MKGWCPSCETVRDPGPARTRAEFICPVCGLPLRSTLARHRSQLERKPENQLRSKVAKPAMSIAQAMRARQRDWSMARAKVDAYDGCVWSSLSECEGGESAEACHVIGRDRDAFPPLKLNAEILDAWLAAEERGVWLVVPARVVPGCTKHHRLYDDGEIPLLGRLTLEEELQAVADAHTEGTRESGISIAVNHHLDRPAYRQERAA